MPPETKELLRDLTAPQREAVLCMSRARCWCSPPRAVGQDAGDHAPDRAPAVGGGRPRMVDPGADLHEQGRGRDAGACGDAAGRGDPARGRVGVLRQRAGDAGPDADDVPLAWCARLLRRYAGERCPGSSPTSRSTTTSDQHGARAKRVLADLQLSTSNLAAPHGAERRSVQRQERAPGRGRRSRRVASGYFHAQHGRPGVQVVREGAAAPQANAVDFDDLLVLTARMLQDRRLRCGASSRSRWRYLLIDEYQDTNHAQFDDRELIAWRRGLGRDAAASRARRHQGRARTSAWWATRTRRSTGGAGRTSTTSWTSSSTTPTPEVIALGENFRSTAPILRRGGRADPAQHGGGGHKPLFTSQAPGASRVELVLITRDEHHEARTVSRTGSGPGTSGAEGRGRPGHGKTWRCSTAPTRSAA
jgi:hypothetical protein